MSDYDVDLAARMGDTARPATPGDTSDAFRAHVKELERRALGGDLDATKSLAAMALLAGGWRYGDD